MPGHAKSGPRLGALSENRATSRFTSRSGSLNDVAGTWNHPPRTIASRNCLVRIVSSRTLVTSRGACPAYEHKARLIVTISCAPSAAHRTTGANVAREDRARWFERRGALVRDAEDARPCPALPWPVQEVEVAQRVPTSLPSSAWRGARPNGELQSWPHSPAAPGRNLVAKNSL